MSVSQEKLNTIRKLIAKAQGTTNAHEAAIFMNKAQAMMADLGVDMEAVDLSAIKEQGVKSQFSVSRVKIYENTLMHSIARAFGCQLMWLRNSSWRRMIGEDNYASFIFVGSADRLPLATYAAEVLGRQLRKARADFSDARSRHYWAIALEGYEDPREIFDVKDACRSAIRKQVTKEADSFAMGWAYEIQKKATKFALNDREQLLLDTYIKNQAGDEEAQNAKSLKIDPNAYYAGIEAAKDAHLHRPIDGSAEEVNLLGDTKQLGYGG